MVQALSISENIHTILRVLYDDMMILCYPMAKVATAIAGIGALIYIAYRIWQAMARAEPIDLFPLLRPMAIGICIMFFPTLVLGSLNGILSPLVQATHSLMVGQTFDMQEWRQECARLEQESRERFRRRATTPKTRRRSASCRPWASTSSRNRPSTGCRANGSRGASRG